MAFVHGSKQKIVWNGFDLTATSKNLDIDLMVDKAETSVFGLASKTFITGLKDAKVTLQGLLDGAVGGNDPEMFADLAATATAGLVGTSYPQGDARGNAGYGFLSFETSFKISTPLHDVTSMDATLEVTGGTDRVLSHFAMAASGGAVAQPGTAIDNAASSAAGGAGYVQCDGAGSAGASTVKIQHSTDNITFVDLITFTALATNVKSAQRLTVAGTVNRYTGVAISATTNGAKVQASFGRF